MSRSYKHNLYVKTPGSVTKRLANKRVRVYLAKGGILRNKAYKRVSETWDLFEKYSLGCNSLLEYKKRTNAIWLSELYAWERKLTGEYCSERAKLIVAESLLKELGFIKPPLISLSDFISSKEFIYSSFKFKTLYELELETQLRFVRKNINFCKNKINTLDSDSLKQYLFFKRK